MYELQWDLVCFQKNYLLEYLYFTCVNIMLSSILILGMHRSTARSESSESCAKIPSFLSFLVLETMTQKFQIHWSYLGLRTSHLRVEQNTINKVQWLLIPNNVVPKHNDLLSVMAMKRVLAFLYISRVNHVYYSLRPIDCAIIGNVPFKLCQLWPNL
jgi:hypothetical protein